MAETREKKLPEKAKFVRNFTKVEISTPATRDESQAETTSAASVQAQAEALSEARDAAQNGIASEARGVKQPPATSAASDEAQYNVVSGNKGQIQPGSERETRNKHFWVQKRAKRESYWLFKKSKYPLAQVESFLSEVYIFLAGAGCVAKYRVLYDKNGETCGVISRKLPHIDFLDYKESLPGKRIDRQSVLDIELFSILVASWFLKEVDLNYSNLIVTLLNKAGRIDLEESHADLNIQYLAAADDELDLKMQRFFERQKRKLKREAKEIKRNFPESEWEERMKRCKQEFIKIKKQQKKQADERLHCKLITSNIKSIQVIDEMSVKFFPFFTFTGDYARRAKWPTNSFITRNYAKVFNFNLSELLNDSTANLQRYKMMLKCTLLQGDILEPMARAHILDEELVDEHIKLDEQRAELLKSELVNCENFYKVISANPNLVEIILAEIAEYNSSFKPEKYPHRLIDLDWAREQLEAVIIATQINFAPQQEPELEKCSMGTLSGAADVATEENTVVMRV